MIWALDVLSKVGEFHSFSGIEDLVVFNFRLRDGVSLVKEVYVILKVGERVRIISSKVDIYGRCRGGMLFVLEYFIVVSARE